MLEAVEDNLLNIKKQFNVRNNDIFYKLVAKHKIWANPLLIACMNKKLSIDDYRFIFSQYYFYSKSFTRLLAVGMLKCENDYYRSQLSQNIWEEGGGKEINLRHSEMFRVFLIKCLGIEIDNINFEVYSKYFFEQYINLCLNSQADECAAILAFATEGIVPKIYSAFKDGLLGIGLPEEELEFFNLHIEHDDAHALTLADMAMSYTQNNHWYDRCAEAINRALDLRDEFFSHLYKTIQYGKMRDLVEQVTTRKGAKKPIQGKYKASIHTKNTKLYSNEDLENNIKFTVDRVEFGATVLDPRIVHIPVGFSNEFHSHAHETVFLIVEGNGTAVIGDEIITVAEGDVVYVPRWLKHQTKNTGEKVLTFFAITDYGLTGRFSDNTEDSYRLSKT